ncbi:MAG: AAA family ATPase [Chloroflexota bacterium]|nr:AAA family ATPase [Chloroflexota bacterium]MDE2960938.1 AAA family ATPase [Chloroflexota bacterium]
MKLPTIESVHIRGFRSLADAKISGLADATVLIGANGSGKSNFIRFFEMLSWMLRSHRLGEFIERQGGADDQLYKGNRVTPRLEAEIALRTSRGRNDYGFALSYAHPDRFFFTEERFRFSDNAVEGTASWEYPNSGQREAAIVEAAQGKIPNVNPTTARTIVYLLRSCAVYQFHDTSDSSNFKRSWDVTDNTQLRSHGGNLAAILYRLEHEDIRRYEMICRQIGRILPGFNRFAIEERYGKVLLRWQSKESDKTFGAHLTSDGSLRFFALVTLLNLPPEMLPNVLLLDEPELGLHPSAVSLVGGMIRSLSNERQVIIATQSPLLVDAFELDEIIVLELEDGRTQVREKLDQERYQVWLEEFTVGDLWRKNLLGGRP